MKRALFIPVILLLIWSCRSEDPSGDAQTAIDTGELPCDTMALRIALNNDPLYIEAMDPENPFYTFMQETDSITFDRLNQKFLELYEGGGVREAPCSQAYIDAFQSDPEVQHFAIILCEQMELNQAIKDKYPCIMQLNEEDRAAVLKL